MNKKKVLGILLAAMTALAVAAAAFAATDEATARRLAEKWVPASAVYLLTKAEKDEYEVKFLDKEAGVDYEVEVSKLTGAVTEVTTKVKTDRGGLKVNLGRADVENIVRSEFPAAAIQQLELESDDGYRHYEVKFTQGAVRGTMEINPETGAIMERELKY